MVLKKKSAYESGFSLMELLVITGIIGIILSISIPYISSSLPDYRLRSATRDIVSLMQELKFRAVKENATAAVIFDVPGNKYTSWVDNGWGGGADNWWPDTNVGEVIIRQESLPKEISFYVNTGFTANTFGFNNRGFPAAAVGSVFIKNTKSNYRRIIINQAGNIRVDKSSDGVTWN